MRNPVPALQTGQTLARRKEHVTHITFNSSGNQVLVQIREHDPLLDSKPLPESLYMQSFTSLPDDKSTQELASTDHIGLSVLGMDCTRLPSADLLRILELPGMSGADVSPNSSDTTHLNLRDEKLRKELCYAKVCLSGLVNLVYALRNASDSSRGGAAETAAEPGMQLTSRRS